MTGSRAHAIWTWTFLPLTVLVFVAEFVAASRWVRDAAPWTDYVITYLPPWLAFVLVALLNTWLWAHFYQEYRKRGKL